MFGIFLDFLFLAEQKIRDLQDFWEARINKHKLLAQQIYVYEHHYVLTSMIEFVK